MLMDRLESRSVVRARSREVELHSGSFTLPFLSRFQVNYLGEPTVFSATQLVAMYLGRLRDQTAIELNQAVSDVVVSVPGWFTDTQRRAMLNASEIAGLNCLRIMNDLTAVALGYGITKSDLPESAEAPRHVIFIDVGHSNFSVAVVAFSKGQLVVKSSAYDRNFGGRDLDYALVQHFAKEFQTKYKVRTTSLRLLILTIQVELYSFTT
jgi:heat shock protein 4